MQVRVYAQRAPGLGETAVGGHKQACAERAAVVQLQAGLVGAGVHRQDAGVGMQVDTGRFLHRPPGRTPDQVVGHQAAQPLLAAVFRTDAQLVGQVAVHHLGAAQCEHLVGRDMRQHSLFAQQPQRAVGQGDLAAIEGRFGQRRFGLALDQGHAQALQAQRPCQAQPDRAGADDGDIVGGIVGHVLAPGGIAPV